jgi:MFS family permease
MASPRHGLLAAWLIVLLCFLALAVSFSARTSIGLVMDPIEKELGWDRTFTSAGYAISAVVMAIMSPIAGNLVDRFGARVLLSVGLVTVGAGMILTAGAYSPWQFILAYSIVAGLGFGMAATHVVSTIVTLEFDKGRGVAVGTATAGSTAGQLVVMPILASVLATTSWRQSYVVLGLACLALIPLVLLLIRPRRAAPRHAARPSEPAAPLGQRLGFLFRSPVFHLLFWSYFICGITTSGVIEAHLIPYAVFCGYPPLDSAYAYSLLSAVNLGGMVLAGWLTDRMNRPLLLGGIYVLRAFTFILLMFIAQDYSLLLIFAVLFGLFDYSTVPVTASLTASHLGIRIMGLTMGLLSAGHALGAAAGAQLAGLLFDLFASYQWVWIVALATALLAGVLCFAIREDRTGEGRLVPAAA